MSSRTATETILVVDDELTVLSLVQLMLARDGYGVLVASSGAEALRLFEIWPDIHIDLVIVDLMMPEMNGVELAARLHALRPDLPVLHFSGYTDQEPLRQTHDQAPFIAKPFTPPQLTKKIREILDAAKTASAGSSDSE